MDNISKILDQLASNVVYAQNTTSTYYNIGCIKVRVSDHLSTNPDAELALFIKKLHGHNFYIIIPLVGMFKELQWFTNTSDVVDFIVQFEKMYKLLIKRPTEVVDKHERVVANVTAGLKELVARGEKMRYGDWKSQMRFLYNPKNCEAEMNKLLDEIYSLGGGTEEIAKRLKKCGPATLQGKRKCVMSVLEQIRSEQQ